MAASAGAVEIVGVAATAPVAAAAGLVDGAWVSGCGWLFSWGEAPDVVGAGGAIGETGMP